MRERAHLSAGFEGGASAEGGRGADGAGSAPATPAQVLRYEIDPAGRLERIGPGWLEFAAANGAPDLDPEALRGRPLLSFVSGVETREVLRELMSRARDERRPISYLFRCDAPDMRRLLEMTVTPRDDGGLTFESHTLREEPREPLSLLAADAQRGGEALAVCSWCKRVDVDGEWVRMELAAERLALFERPAMPPLTHGNCPDCMAVWFARPGSGA